MAKLKVNEVEATSTNADVKVITKGSTGALEVKGNSASEGTLQLNCSAQSHGVKIKAPSNSADLGYTMTLPDNQIAANKGLKVKSVASNVAQLEYGDFPSADISTTPLDAANLTSGTIPAANMPSFPASTGLGFKLVGDQTVTASSVTSVNFTGLENNSTYHLVIKHCECDGNVGNPTFYMRWLDSSNNTVLANYVAGSHWEYYDPTNGDRRYQSFTNFVGVPLATPAASYAASTSGFYNPFAGHIDFTTGNDSATTVNGTQRSGMWGCGQTFGKGFQGSIETWFGISWSYKQYRIHGIQLGYYFNGNIKPNVGCQFLLYKYVES